MAEYISAQFKFHFKQRSVKEDTPDGTVTIKLPKQPSIEAALPTLSAQGIIDTLLQGGKEAELITATVNSIFYLAARGQFDDAIENLPEPSMQISANVLDFDKLSLSYIANLPPASRGAAALSQEEWDYFYADYLQVMVAATGKEEKRIANQIEHFKKPQRVKVNSKVLEVLVDQLSIYVTKTAALEDTGACAERLLAKFAKWIVDLATANDPDAI